MNAYLASSGLQFMGETIVNTTIISAPCSTKNQTEARDLKMRQTRKSLPQRSLGAARGIMA
jgi:transposase, IS5 family